ncbi:hypothetical protein I4U23_006503 [Adineta vaga]|nr:hypothetical protein I4U23_006503 [Adineta vaga]
MSDNYALFIITIPNDSDADNLMTTTKDTLSISKPQSRRASVDTVSALMVPAAIPLAIQPTLTSLVERKSEHDISLTLQRTFPIAICPLLKNYLAERNEFDPVWILSENKKTFQITFYVEFGFVSDRILHDLAKLGIGKRHGTKIFVLPTTVIFKGHDDHENNNDRNDSHSSSLNSIEDAHHTLADKSSLNKNEDNITSNDNILSRKVPKRIRKSNFKKSVRARLMVHQVVASIRASSAITFDFLLLICLASMLAAFGLLENSTVIIVASMLVSPLMNPILGIVFGLSVRDNSLWQRGLRNEIIGLIVCITCGFLLGLFTTYFETKWGSSSSFPTSEMKSRGDGKRLWVGILIALPSGAGVALSVLGGNTGSLVGVAISASLLPPAVNCGLLFAYSLLGKIFSDLVAVQSLPLNDTHGYFSSSLNCPKYYQNDYHPLYTCNLANETAILACCSLLLTIVNIVCIIIMALIILRIKEVVPLNQTNKDIADFFHHDVPVARDYNKTIHEGDFDLEALSATTTTTTTPIHRNPLARTIVDRWKSLKHSTSSRHHQQSKHASSISINLDLESTNHMNDLESRRKLFHLQTFLKEYDLDILNTDDYELVSNDSREKVRRLVRDLIDTYQEIPLVFVEHYRLQPFGTQTASTAKEQLSFYQEIIENLPPKWHQMYVYERQRRLMTAWPLPFDQSFSERPRPLEKYAHSTSDPTNRNHHESLKKQSRKSRLRFARQNSDPESNISSQETRQVAEQPIIGTRFRIAKPIITSQMHGNESKLI